MSITDNQASQEFEPLGLVEEIAAELAPVAWAKNVEISSFCQPSLARVVTGNREGIKLALTSLTKFAIEQTPIGAVVVEALLDRVEGADSIRWGVSETSGNALSTAQLSHFAKTVICPDGSKCGDVLARMHCTLEGENLHGYGARFYFVQKLVRAEGSAIEERLPPYFSDLKVFVVSNDPPQNRGIQNYLRYAGAILDGAPTGSETMLALAKAATMGEPYELVIVVTPIEDLSPTAIALQITESALSAPKLMFIGPNEETCREHLYSKEFQVALCKPIKQQALYDTVARLMGHGQLYEQRNNKPLMLIVEDNLINQKILLFQLRTLGYEAEIVSNGQEAVEAVAKTSYAAILMDLQMPVLDGMEATKIIRANERAGGHVPIVAVTANEDWKQDALNCGVDDFVAKPASIDTLKSVLQRLVHARRWVS